MSRYFIYLQFDGTRYHGWQIQPNGISVQEELQRALTTLLRQPIEVVGAGRTDAGVHAHQMVAHFDVDNIDSPLLLPSCTGRAGGGSLDSRLATLDQLVYKLNRFLPYDISIDKIIPVDGDMHARFSATSRTYHYYIHQQKAPFLRHYSVEMHYDLDFDAMNEAASHLLNVEDFAAFCKTGSDVKTTLCNVTEARWVPSTLYPRLSTLDPRPSTSMCFIITANRFLRNMVRAVVGTLIEVGRHRITIEQFDNIIAGKQRTAAGESMPAHGLSLWDITY